MNYNYFEQRFELGTETYELVEQDQRVVDHQFYENCTSRDTLKWFRNLGGTEILKHKGNKHILTSYSPDKGVKVIRTFTEI